MDYITESLNSSHKRKQFSCGKPTLDTYLQKQASQDIRKKISACFVKVESDKIVQGYYTLSSDNIPNEQLPEALKKKMPSAYHHLPTTLLGRLAVDEAFMGQGLGELLLLDALKRSYDNSSIIGSMAVVVDPLDTSATKFYAKYGFILLPNSGRLFLAMRTARDLF